MFMIALDMDLKMQRQFIWAEEIIHSIVNENQLVSINMEIGCERLSGLDIICG